MAELQLFLIRHASAAERGADYPDDSLRPLVAKGHRQARQLSAFLQRLELSLDRLFSSPYTRAAQTAEPLARLLRSGRRVEYLDSLAAPDYLRLIADLHDYLSPDDRTVALVGHEPYLSALAAYLMTGEVGALAIRFKKGAVLELAGELQGGQMALCSLIPASSYKYL